jgi:hypothetical protein
MTTYNNFDEIITANEVDRNARLAFARKWVKESYGIVDTKGDWIDGLTDVHNHDNLPKHFGQIKLGTAFSTLNTQLVRYEGIWHIGIRTPKNDEGFVLHPANEQSSKTPANEKARLNLLRLVKTGTVQLEVINMASQGTEYTPVATLSGDDIYKQKDLEAAIDDDVTSYNVDNSQNKGTKSVGIDLSAYL